MPTFVSDLEPRALWQHFDRILSIPRGSKNEEGMRRYVAEVADARGAAWKRDATGNVVVRLPATAGREGAAAVVLQSHLDMVCEKNSDVAFDFTRDAIVPRRVDDWLYATGTTLGSDNGIGVAAMLALVGGSGGVHGPLELLFTIDEETGLTGANGIDAGSIGGRRLLNLDTEEEGALYVGCAGGASTEISLPLDSMFGADGRVALAVKVSGLRGGHSGVDIHLQRGNSIQVLARALHAVWREFQFELVTFAGGNLHNAIPREAEALVRVAAGDREAFGRALEAELAAIRAELATVDPGLKWEIGPGTAPPEVMSDETTQKVLAALVALPHGVLRMSDDIPGLVETSTNLATVKTEAGRLRIFQSNRSSVMSALRATQRRVGAFAELAGGDANQMDGYPGWKPDLDSPLLATLKSVHRRVLGSDPSVKAIHAGLECGILGERFPGMDMISFGPQIEFPHSPDERVLIPSVDRFWRLLGAVLEELAR
ncbi:MAG: aminoacyl-histidine dipeptidase [Thermoanaerobaculia bacterium]